MRLRAIYDSRDIVLILHFLHFLYFLLFLFFYA